MCKSREEWEAGWSYKVAITVTVTFTGCVHTSLENKGLAQAAKVS